MKINVYLNDVNSKPISTITPPERFNLDTEGIDDGEHQLILVAEDHEGNQGVKKVTFTVQNGPYIDVHGLKEGERLQGTVSLLANAYSSKRGDEFEPHRIETPKPIPTWAWVLFLCVIAWGVGYVTLEYSGHRALAGSTSIASSQAESDAGHQGGESGGKGGGEWW